MKVTEERGWRRGPQRRFQEGRKRQWERLEPIWELCTAEKLFRGGQLGSWG